jgi:hypothetical protein
LGVTVTGPERVHTLLSLSKGADQPQAAAGGRIQRQHSMHQQAMDVAVANLAQATPAPLGGAEMNLVGILDRQNMPACRRTSGLVAPTVQQRRNRYVWIGEKPAIADERRTAPTGQSAHAYRGMRNHTFQQRSPPLSRRRSPNPPTDHSISSRAILAIVRLPDASMPCTAAYPCARREASAVSRSQSGAPRCVHPLVRLRHKIFMSLNWFINFKASILKKINLFKWLQCL